MEPVEIKLRAKYLKTDRGRYRSSHNDSGHHKRNKIGYEKHVKLYGVPPHRVMVMEPSGRTHMVTLRRVA